MAESIVAPSRHVQLTARKQESLRATEEAKAIATEEDLDAVAAMGLAHWLERSIQIAGRERPIPEHQRTPAARRQQFLDKYHSLLD